MTEPRPLTLICEGTFDPIILTPGGATMAKSGKTAKALKSVGREMKKNPPKQLAKTRAKSGAAAAEKQRKAILLNKARKRGARIPKA